jgi:glycosyltransferase involved in cell wall biosynthesis
MTEQPLVSVITIFLNEEQFMEEAVKSVFAQSYSNWELLLVDDGSTDRSTGMAQEYARRFPARVRYLEHENHKNRGMSASRNLGLKYASGEFVAFLDADDVWLPHKLEQQVEIFQSQPEAGMLYGRTVHWSSWPGSPWADHPDHLGQQGVRPNSLVRPPRLLTNYLKDDRNYPCMCSVLVRREVALQVGGFEDAFRDLGEDMVFHSKIFLESPVFVAGEVWDLYRIHPDNSWHVASTTGRYNPDDPNPKEGKFHLWLQDYLRQRQERDPELHRALKNAMWRFRHPKLYRPIRRLREARERGAVATLHGARRKILRALGLHLD